MKPTSRATSFVALLVAALSTAACAGGPAIPFRFEFSRVEVRRTHDSHHQDLSRSHRGYHEESSRTYRSSRSCGCGSGEAIRLIGGCQPGKSTRPSGWHKRDWYERRGYKLENYVHKHRDGTVHRGRNVRHRR